jgi:hypothetical protein
MAEREFLKSIEECKKENTLCIGTTLNGTRSILIFSIEKIKSALVDLDSKIIKIIFSDGESTAFKDAWLFQYREKD